MTVIKRKGEMGQTGNAGQFAAAERGESSVEIRALVFDAMTASPAEADERLVDLCRRAARAESSFAHAMASLRVTVRADRNESDDEVLERSQGMELARDSRKRAIALRRDLRDLTGQIGRIEKAYADHPWRRHLFVPNPGGHLHSDPECSQLHKGRARTVLELVPAMSGRSDDEAVELAGTRACATCYPAAAAATGSGEIPVPEDLEQIERDARKRQREADRTEAWADFRRATAARKRRPGAEHAGATADGTPLEIATGSAFGGEVYRGSESFATEDEAVRWYVARSAAREAAVAEADDAARQADQYAGAEREEWTMAAVAMREVIAMDDEARAQIVRSLAATSPRTTPEKMRELLDAEADAYRRTTGV